MDDISKIVIEVKATNSKDYSYSIANAIGGSEKTNKYANTLASFISLFLDQMNYTMCQFKESGIPVDIFSEIDPSIIRSNINNLKKQ